MNPVEQARRAYRFALWLVTSTLSLSAFAGFASASESEPNNESDGGNAPQTYVLETVPQPILTLSGGLRTEKLGDNGFVLHSGPIAWTGANVSLSNGWSVNTWESRSLSGSNGSDENDLGVCKTGSIGANALTGCFAYYDIRPLFNAKGGDIVSPYAELDRPLGQNWTVIGKVAAYLHTEKPGNDGGVVSAGLQKTFQAGNLSLVQVGSVAVSDGPFQQKAGAEFRYDASLKVPLTNRMKLEILWVKAFKPLLGARDRGPVFSFGTGLTLAY